jgi:hypothetical protein
MPGGRRAVTTSALNGVVTVDKGICFENPFADCNMDDMKEKKFRNFSVTTVTTFWGYIHCILPVLFPYAMKEGKRTTQIASYFGGNSGNGGVSR